jgi:hypothetical protein
MLNDNMLSFRYGDRFPITRAGRIFAIIWALIGISISSIMIGSICSSLTVTVVKEFGVGVGQGTTVRKWKLIVISMYLFIYLFIYDKRTKYRRRIDNMTRGPLRSNWNLEMLILTEGGKPKDPEKNPRGKGENHQTT